MSADLSDPAITSAIDSITDPVSPISWLALSYHPTADKTLSLVSTGFDPWIPRWQEVIEARKREPLFGYGLVGKGRPMREGGEKGVVLVYLPEKVTGVRRARAIVHSRALANKFPDYSAIITISEPSQISEDFVRSQVNFYNQPVPTPTSSPVKPRTPAQLGLGHPSNGRTSPLPSPHIRSIQTSSSSTRSMDRPLPPPPAEPIEVPDPAPTTPRAPSPTPTSPNRHSRKNSLSSRFAKALPSFRSSGETSPRSPNRSTFDSLTSGYGRGRRDVSKGENPQNPQVIAEHGSVEDLRTVRMAEDGPSGLNRASQQDIVGPVAEESVANTPLPPLSPPPPPLPPKLPDPPPLNRLYTLGPVIDQQQHIGDFSSHSLNNGSAFITPFPPAQSGLSESSLLKSTSLHPVSEMGQPTASHVTHPSSDSSLIASPLSPTASAALYSAREKQLHAETLLHEEFRRTEERRQRANSVPREVDADSEDGLPYDRDGEESNAKISGKRKGLVLATTTGSDTDDEKKHSPPPVYASRVDLGRDMETSGTSDAAHPGVPLIGMEARYAAEDGSRGIAEAEGAPDHISEDPRWSKEELEEIRQMEERRVLDEQAQQEQERARLEREEAERRAARLREEEKRRLEEEEARRAIQRREEEERQRETERIEAARRAQEEEKEKARLAEEAVRARKDRLRAELQKGKATGGMMLQGYVTVQTTKSVTWRRRHFLLFPTEIRLFKTDTDTTPIQIIPLVGAQVTETYEESQVQGSFKIICETEDFFLFSDSREEKEELLDGLSVALE